MDQLTMWRLDVASWLADRGNSGYADAVLAQGVGFPPERAGEVLNHPWFRRVTDGTVWLTRAGRMALLEAV